MELPDFVRRNVLLADYSTLGVGGPADYFAEIIVDPNTPGRPFNADVKLVEVYEFARDSGLDIFTLGRGSNVMFSDHGFPGLVIHMNLRELRYKYISDELWVDAGVLVSEIVSLGENLSFTGFECFAGLPGTVGGAIYGNAGCYNGQFWDVVEIVMFFDGEYILGKKKEAVMFGYRWSFFKDHPEYMIVSAKLKIELKDSRLVIAETKRIRRLRQASQSTYRSVGCIFKNPEVNGERVSAGSLIDKAGLKGVQVGEAMISRKHANFFVNLGGAKASDFIELIKIAKGRVLKKFGILLEEEIVLVGKF